MYTRISWSPDGRQIAVERTGDDGFSRMGVIDASGRLPGWDANETRDTYFASWSADNSRLLYFEGNSFQGAPSNLWSVRRSGTSRRVVVKDAAGERTVYGEREHAAGYEGWILVNWVGDSLEVKIYYNGALAEQYTVSGSGG